MFRSLTACAMAAGAALAAAPAMAQQSCTRAELQAAADSYVAAQTAGDPSKLKLAKLHAYKEEFELADMATGIVSKPLKIDWSHSILDEVQCETVSELVVLDKSHPYVLGVHLEVRGGEIAEVDSIVTDDDDWLFSAERFLTGIKDEVWSEIPEAQRDTRKTLISAANAYLDMFTNKDAAPPWNEPCYRQEGGMRTKGSCHSDPLGVEFPNRYFVVDTTLGVVDAWVAFSGRSPDSHMFRIENGKIKFIHTITNCSPRFNCGFDLSEDLAAERRARGGNLGPAKDEKKTP